MFDRIAKTLRLPIARLACLVCLFCAVAPAAAQTPSPLAPAQFDPSDVYFQGYLAIRKAEELETSEDYVGAADKLEKARKLFETVRRYYPDWKPEMVAGRSAQNAEAATRLYPKAEEQRRKNRNVVAELEGGVKNSGTLIDPAQGVMPLSPGILEVEPLAARRLADAEAEVKRLQALSQSPQSFSNSSDAARQRSALQSQLNAAENDVKSLRSRLTTNPVESEVNTLNQRIAGLEQEREAMAMALTQSRSAHTDALSRNAILEADLKVMQQKRADLDNALKVERNVANSVVAGQRAQLKALEKELDQKSNELGKANERIAGLINELQESKDAFAQLRNERDSLLQERDQMSALLKLNEDGRIQDLIQQNMGLAKNLREANEKVERLNVDNNSAKDDIIDALRDLAIAKSQINKLHQERRDQDKRLADLENRLQGEEAALSSGKVSTDPAEVAVLRDIIQRQLRVQERRRQARDLLIEAVKDMGSKDERIAQAITLFEGQEIQLSPDEQRILADKEVDGEFISPFAQDRATVGRNTSELNRDIAVFERTAEKSFTAGRFLPTRELFQMIVEQHPGHIPALCKLGVVNLKLQDPTAAIDTFQRAVELDANNPYAFRMLGYSFMTLGDLASAEKNVKRSVDLAPQDAKSQLLLATIYYRLGRKAEAESHYKASISADPLPSDPYYNLALICSRSKRLEAAKDYYQQALERGAVPDPTLEQRLAQP
jgi:tetratricopeptide (TPR) repeat protein